MTVHTSLPVFKDFVAAQCILSANLVLDLGHKIATHHVIDS